MSGLPPRQYFEQHLNQPFTLTGHDGLCRSLHLLAVVPAAAMSPQHECFSIEFQVPEGASLPQGVYRLGGPCGSAWDLLFAPTLPDQSGRRILEAVLHCERAALR